RKPLKPFACGNAGPIRWTCGDLLVCFHLSRTRLRVHGTPGIPHALRGGTNKHDFGRAAPREAFVMPGLDPGIHRSSQSASRKMDRRVEPGDDELNKEFELRRYLCAKRCRWLASKRCASVS